MGEGVKDYFTINVDGTSATYEGSWVDNNPEGKGELKTKNGKNWYKGNFKAGKFDGNGELRLDIGMSEGVRIKGTFKNGEPNGLMKVSQWTFLGLVKSEVTASAYSWQDLIEPIKKVAGDFSDILTGYSSVNGSNVKVTEWEEMWWALSDDKIKYIKCGQYISNIVFHTDDDRPYSVTGYDGKFLGSFKSYEEAITSATQNINSVCY